MRAHDHDRPVIPRPKAVRPHAPAAAATARAAVSGRWDAVSAGGLLALQRAVGNRAVSSMLSSIPGSASAPTQGPRTIQRDVVIGKIKYGSDKLGEVIKQMRVEMKQPRLTLSQDQVAALKKLLAPGEDKPFLNFAVLYADLPAPPAPVNRVESADQAVAFLEGKKVAYSTGGWSDPSGALHALQGDQQLHLCCHMWSPVRQQIDKGTFAAVAPRVVLMTRDSEGAVAVRRLASQHQVSRISSVGELKAWMGDKKIATVMGQTPQMRGDMHDVVPALHLQEDLGVVLCLSDDAGGVKDANEILSYYSAVKGKVCLFGGRLDEPKAALPEKATLPGEKAFKPVTWATGVLYDAAIANPVGTRERIRAATTGGPLNEEDERLYEADVTDHHFKRGENYIIVNYRDSGHNPGPGRERSHPEFDSGTAGFLQLLQLVADCGYVPVPMGMPPDASSYLNGPNLIEYWRWPSCQVRGTRNKRQMEYGLLRYLATKYSVRGLSMRSGSTDAMVFAGIETISLDLATEGVGEKEAEAAGLSQTTGSARSWRRAAMRELIIAGGFHQGFMQNPRPKGEEGPTWKGAFSGEELQNIVKTIKYFFASSPTGRVLGPAPDSPLTQPEKFAERIPDVDSQSGESGQRKKFLDFAAELNKLHNEQREDPIKVFGSEKIPVKQ